MVWALSLMHLKNLVHNDIKPDNILLDKDEKGLIFPVITDFGVVHVLDSADAIKSMKIVRLNAATKSYAAPEVLQCLPQNTQKTFGKSSDVFSVGIVCVEMYTRKNAWDKFNEEQVIKGSVQVTKWNLSWETKRLKTNFLR
jgi:serine/threonine protein kinase